MSIQSKTFEKMVSFFTQEDWKFSPLTNEARAIMGLALEYDGTTGHWPCKAFAEADFLLETMLFYSICPFSVSRDKQPHVAELLYRINYSISQGNLEMNFDTGEVRCKTYA